MTSKRGTAPSSTTRGDSMFLMTLGEDPLNNGTMTAIDDTDDTAGAPILSWSLGVPTRRDPPAKEPVYDRSETDGPRGEPLFVRGADITAPDDSRPMPAKDRPMASSCAGIVGGFSPRSLSLIEMIRQRDPNKAIIPAYC